MGLRLRVGRGVAVKLFGRNKFGASCAATGAWVDPGAGWRARVNGRYVTVSAEAAARCAVPVVLELPNDRHGPCWYCGAEIEPRAGVLMVDHSGPRDVFAAMHRECAPFVPGGVEVVP